MMHLYSGIHNGTFYSDVVARENIETLITDLVRTNINVQGGKALLEAARFMTKPTSLITNHNFMASLQVARDVETLKALLAVTPEELIKQNSHNILRQIYWIRTGHGMPLERMTIEEALQNLQGFLPLDTIEDQFETHHGSFPDPEARSNAVETLKTELGAVVQRMGRLQKSKSLSTIDQSHIENLARDTILYIDFMQQEEAKIVEYISGQLAGSTDAQHNVDSGSESGSLSVYRKYTEILTNLMDALTSLLAKNQSISGSHGNSASINALKVMLDQYIFPVQKRLNSDQIKIFNADHASAVEIRLSPRGQRLATLIKRFEDFSTALQLMQQESQDQRDKLISEQELKGHMESRKKELQMTKLMLEGKELAPEKLETLQQEISEDLSKRNGMKQKFAKKS